jgi:GR25 family glycosyltransferase involved in LPS biosynthesis
LQTVRPSFKIYNKNPHFGPRQTTLNRKADNTLLISIKSIILAYIIKAVLIKAWGLFQLKVFLINLDRRPDRLAEMRERLKSIGLEFERISAFDGKTRSKVGLVSWGKAYVYNDFVRPPLGQIGVYHSNRQVWKIMVERNIPQALVLEDDVVPVDWDPEICKVNLSDYGLDQLRLEALDMKVHDPMPMVQRSATVLGRETLNEATYGAGAYLITLAGAQKCLAVGRFWYNIDHYDMWSNIAGLRTAVLRPAMWRQSGSPSDIATTRHDTDWRSGKFLYVVKEILWRLRRPLVRPVTRYLRADLKRRSLSR